MKKPPLPEIGLLRLSTILDLIPISRSSWWKGVSEQKYPAPLKLGPRTTVWRVEDIRNLIERGVT